MGSRGTASKMLQKVPIWIVGMMGSFVVHNQLRILWSNFSDYSFKHRKDASKLQKTNKQLAH